MGFWAILWMVITGVIAAGIGIWIFNAPKITTPYWEGWIHPPKRINTYWVQEYPTASYLSKELKTQDYYTFYGITIRNEKRIIPAMEAKITKVNMRIWNSKCEPVTDEYNVRWWNRKHSGIDPLFSGKKQITDKTIGQGEELDLVIAYNQENDDNFYRFTIETPTFNNFPVYTDRFKDPMPHYAMLSVHGNRINKTIYLLIESANNKELRINILPKKDFPSEIKKV